MSSTTKDAENRRKSSRPAGCVEYRRSAASSLLDDICRLVTLSLHLNNPRHNEDIQGLGWLPIC